MTAERFEQRVADWLEDGPEDAPVAIVDVALAHAAAHPRSRARVIARRLRRPGGLLAAAVVIAVVAAGSLVVSTRILPPMSPVAPVSLSGSETCETRVTGQVLVPQSSAAVDAGVGSELLGRIDVCSEAASDPRVGGTLTRHVDGWIFDADAADPLGTATHFGSFTLENEDGGWSGSLVATYRSRASQVDGRMSWLALGSGGYAGLAYRATVVTDPAGHSSVSGTIEPVASDAAIGETWCWVDVAEPDLSAPAPVIHRVAERSCTVTSDDHRVAGTASERRTIDVRPDGSTVDAGTLELATASGTWAGSFSGSGDWYVPGEVRGVLAGGGGLVGQRLTVRIISEDGMHGILVATVSRAP